MRDRSISACTGAKVLGVFGVAGGLRKLGQSVEGLQIAGSHGDQPLELSAFVFVVATVRADPGGNPPSLCFRRIGRLGGCSSACCTRSPPVGGHSQCSAGSDQTGTSWGRRIRHASRQPRRRFVVARTNRQVCSAPARRGHRRELI